MRDSDCKLDCECLLICEGPVESVVDGRPGLGSVSTGSLSTEFDSSAAARLFFGCMLNKYYTERRLTLGREKCLTGQFRSPPTHVFILKIWSRYQLRRG